MSAAVENAEVMLYAVSEAYKESARPFPRRAAAAQRIGLTRRANLKFTGFAHTFQVDPAV